MTPSSKNANGRSKPLKIHLLNREIIIDGTGGSYNPIAKKKKLLEDLGYDCYMIFVDTTMKTAMERNQNRDTRRLLDKVVKRNWK